MSDGRHRAPEPESVAGIDESIEIDADRRSEWRLIPQALIALVVVAGIVVLRGCFL
ncbi:hypothetical protein K8P10_000973 [Leucobacter sp. Psy1]|uniref:hypothetical protein n=1 Tax=Leucobacter sp. Psy1 TaxID=2875729 RepID=UPI001CD816BA|nr:hypothetical protein [Leucobacter sp. Psy1]UBH05462.1 hypothetical protein K8P10_000973 [Leucobacter sp. Psy1]